MEQLKNKVFDSMDDTCNFMIERYHDGFEIGIVDMKGNISEAVMYLLKQGFNIASIDISFDDDYTKEYYLTINDDGIWVQKMFDANHGYLNLFDDLVLIEEDCNSKIITKNMNNDCNFTSYFIKSDEDDKDVYDDDDIKRNININRNSNGKVIGFCITNESCKDNFSIKVTSDNDKIVEEIAKSLGVDLNPEF